MIRISKLKAALKNSERISKGEDFLTDGFIAVLNGSADIEAVFTAAAEKKNLKITELNYKIDRFLNRDAEILTAEPRCKEDILYFIQDDKIHCLKRQFFEVFKPKDFEKIEIKTNNYIFEFWDNSEYIPVFVGLAMGCRIPQGVTLEDIKNFPLLSEVEAAEKRERAEKRETAKNKLRLVKREYYINTIEGFKERVYPKVSGYMLFDSVNGKNINFGLHKTGQGKYVEWTITEISSGFRCFTLKTIESCKKWIEDNKTLVYKKVAEQNESETLKRFRDYTGLKKLA